MSRRRYLLARLAWTVFAAWLVISGTFFLFAYTPDPNESLVGFGAGMAAAQEGGNATKAAQQAVEAYRDARNYDQPVHERYLTWIEAYATFDWGVSYVYGQPVNKVVLEKGHVTALYLVPAVLLSLAVGTLAGLLSATRRRSVPDYVGRAVTYVGLGLPNFWLAELLVLLAITEFQVYAVSRWNDGSPTSPQNWPLLAVAAAVVAVHLLAIQTRYARSETREFLPEPFVKTLRSTGASGTSVARHVLRNAAVPLVSLLFTEVLVAVMVDVFVVEAVLGIPGLGQAAFQAIERRDIGLILGTWMLPMLVVLGGSLAQDAVNVVLDPRLASED